MSCRSPWPLISMGDPAALVMNQGRPSPTRMLMICEPHELETAIEPAGNSELGDISEPSVRRWHVGGQVGMWYVCGTYRGGALLAPALLVQVQVHALLAPISVYVVRLWGSKWEVGDGYVTAM